MRSQSNLMESEKIIRYLPYESNYRFFVCTKLDICLDIIHLFGTVLKTYGFGTNFSSTGIEKGIQNYC